MDQGKIIEFLKSNGFEDAEQVEHKEHFVVRFYYDFEEAEVTAAKAYAKDECTGEEESDEWFEEYFLPYLNDLAIDEVGEVIEEAMEAFGVGAQYISYELDEEEYTYNEFIAVFFEKGKNVEIEDILEDLEL